MRQLRAALPVAVLVAIAACAWAGPNYPPPQGGSGGVSSANLDTTFGSTQGSLLYRNASAWVALTPGTNGHVLTTGGAGANPAWAAAPAGSLGWDDVLAIDATSGANNPTLSGTARLNLGGTTSTFPAISYGSSDGVLELSRADGSGGSVVLQPKDGGHLWLRPGGIAFGIHLRNQANSAKVVVSNAAAYFFDNTENTVASIGSSQSVDVLGTGGIAFKDQTSAPTVTAGYGGIYTANNGGFLTTTVKHGQTGDVVPLENHVVALRRSGSAQSINDETLTAISWDTETVDTAGYHFNATFPTRVVVAKGAGEVWHVAANTMWGDVTGESDFLMQVRLYSSAGTLLERHSQLFPITTIPHMQCAATVVTRASGDYVTIEVYHNDAVGGATNIVDSDVAGFGDADTYVCAVRQR